LIIAAGFLTLFVSIQVAMRNFPRSSSNFSFLQQPETKGEGLKDHVEEEPNLTDGNSDLEMNKKD
jgi:hypothetical protein